MADVFADTSETIKTAFWIEIVHIDPMLDQEAWKLVKGRPDKEWILVDCSSFVFMQQRGIFEAFTTDHHFEQAGSIRLLK
jgi:predicted nucleic acid-binding protein